MLLELTKNHDGKKFIVDTNNLVIYPYQEMGDIYVEIIQGEFKCNIKESVEEVKQMIKVGGIH